MNILYILTFAGVSKPKSGGQNRFINIIDQLTRRNNEIMILESENFIDPNDEHFGVVHRYKDIKISSRVLPLSRDFNLNFIKKIIEIIKDNQIDIILISHPSGMFITKLITWLMRKKVRIVYDAHNVESRFTTEIFSNNNGHSKFERTIIPIYVNLLEKISCKYLTDHILTVSNQDKESLINNYKLVDKVSVLPSGCIIKPLSKKDESYKLKEKLGIDPFSKIVIFHGYYLHPPNKEAFRLIKEFIAPKFKELEENVQFIVGGSDVPVFEDSNFKSVGYIQNLWEFLQTADIAIVPLLKGGGTKLKLLDYLSVGLPVVTTKKGIEGIDAENCEHVIVVNSVDNEFIKKINYLIENEHEMVRIGGNARKLAENKYDWDRIGDHLNNLFEEILK